MFQGNSTVSTRPEEGVGLAQSLSWLVQWSLEKEKQGMSQQDKAYLAGPYRAFEEGGVSSE